MNDAAIEKMRQEFEAGYERKFEADTGRKLTTPVYELREVDHYGDRPYLNGAWQAWQASRAALVITLPPEMTTPDEDDYDGDYEGYEADEHAACMANRMLGKCAAAVKAAGVEVVHEPARS